MIDIYCDGGVIQKNPSTIGGTWAWCHVENGKIIKSGSGWTTPEMADMPVVTNNLTEMLAALYGLGAIEDRRWEGRLYSDSRITLGRLFLGYKWNGIPDWAHIRFQRVVAKLTLWTRIEGILLQGHPTKAELAAGVGRSGFPVSEYNVWCDKECKSQAEKFLAISF